MEMLKFLVQGSEPEPYTVVVKKSEQALSVTCSCRAGVFSQHCKHKFRILSGEKEGIVDGLDGLSQVKNMISGTDVEDVWKEYLQAEEDAEAAKDRLTKCKQRLATLLAGKPK
jgi:hypothetical protein